MRARRKSLLAIAAVAVAAVAVAVAIRSAVAEERSVRAAFDSAQNVVPGLEVRMAGQRVGEVAASERVEDYAQLTLEITDDRVWPLRRGTTAAIRHGTAIGYSTRYVELKPGSEGEPPLADDALLPPARTETPVEFDDAFRIMNKAGRRNLRTFLRRGDRALRGHGPALGRGVAASAKALDAAAGMLGELERQRAALATLVAAGARTTDEIARHRGDLQELVGGVAATYDELAARRATTAATLERLPDTLAVTRRTLGRAETSIGLLDQLAGALAPGARELPSFMDGARNAMSTLRNLAPRATATLSRGAAALPETRRLLADGTPFSARLGRVLDRATPMMSCLRPYAPEIAGFPATWAGVGKNYDAVDHHTRTLGQVPPFPNGSVLTSQQVVENFPGVEYAFPRPPGLNAGEPWFLPRCGVGPDALDPSKDPEAIPVLP